MRFSTARSLALATLVPALLLLVIPGCGKQSEGERCGDEPPSQNDDCGDGLTCKEVNTGDSINRCCYSDGHVTDSRCESRGDSPSTTTTTMDAGSEAGAGGEGN